MEGELAMFVPDGLRANAYRVLRLSADATLSEIHKAAASMRREAALGLAKTSKVDISVLGKVPRTEADIRTAVGRLSNPALRLNDRVFWFHVARKQENHGAPAFTGMAGPLGLSQKAARSHDKALRGLFAAFAAGLDDFGAEAWVRALRVWHKMVSDDDYWALVLDLDERGGFEPIGLPSDLDALRGDALRLAADGLIMAGRDALVRRDASIVSRIVAALEELADTGPWAAIALKDIASPAVEQFQASCRAVCEECSSNIGREQDAAERNRTICDAALERFRGEIEPALNEVIQILPPDHELAQQAHEEAALCLSSIATDYTWADDFITSEQLHEEALELAKDTLGAIRIEDRLAQVRDSVRKQRAFGLAQVRDSVRKQRVFGALKPISSAPSLNTINGVGFRLYGNSDYDAETQSYATTRYFVALFIPIFPVGRYRVVDVSGNRYRFLGKLPLRKGDRWHLSIVVVAIVAIVLSSLIIPSQDAGFSSTSPRRSSYGRETYDVSGAPSTSTEGSTTVSGDTAEPQPAQQRSYDHSRTTELDGLKSRIEAGRSQISILEAHLQPVSDELKGLDTDIRALDSELRSLER